MDIVQLVNQFGNAFEVFQGGQSLLAGIRLVNIEGSAPSSSVYPVAS
ncbi:hypothetical protein ES703_47809 [subsurface metagenome]